MLLLAAIDIKHTERAGLIAELATVTVVGMQQTGKVVEAEEKVAAVAVVVVIVVVLKELLNLLERD